jgi:hypothetical protein
MEPETDDITRFWLHAQQCREAAEDPTRWEDRAMLLLIAEEYAAKAAKLDGQAMMRRQGNGPELAAAE